MLKLLTPFRYFLLDNKEKRRIDIWPTLVLAVGMASVFAFLPSANFFGPGGLLSGLAGLTSSLTGFYVAALVAAATFNHPDLDVEIKYGPVYLDETDSEGVDRKKALTRRELVCIIFGYLSFSALLFSVYAYFSASSAHAISSYIASYSVTIQKIIGLVLLFFSCAWICHIVVGSSLGIYYLTSRLFKHDPKVLTSQEDFFKQNMPGDDG